MPDSQPFGGCVNPAGRAFNFAEVPYRRLIDDYVSHAIAPFGPELLIDEPRPKAKRLKDRREGFAVLYLCFDLKAGLMTTQLALVLISHRPYWTVLADSEQSPPLAQGLAGEVIEGISLKSPLGKELEPACPEPAGESPDAGNAEFDLDFLPGGHA